MYQVKIENNGSLVVRINEQSYTFERAKKHQKKHLDNVHRLARAAHLSGVVGDDLKKDNSETLVEMLLGTHHTALHNLGKQVADEVAVIVFRWQVAGLLEARTMALHYNKRGTNESDHW